MRRLATIAPFVLLLGLSGASAQDKPTAADLLFESPHWSAAVPGATLTYRYTRVSPLADVMGPDIEDRIRLTLETGATADDRTVRVDMFSQARHRAAGPFENTTGNPVVALFLEHHLESLARVLKANPRYLKNAIRASLRDKASMTPATVELGGMTVTGWRVEAQPFTEDPNKHKMRGLDTLTYTFVTADEVPGEIVSIEAKAAASDGVSLLSEVLAYETNAR
jgi:hypothetical protein